MSPMANIIHDFKQHLFPGNVFPWTVFHHYAHSNSKHWKENKSMNFHDTWITREKKSTVKISLTLKTIRIEQVFAFLMALDTAFRAAYTLSGKPPQQALALEAVGWWCGRPHNKVVGGGTGDGVDQGLQGLLVHMHFLIFGEKKIQLLRYRC